MSNLPMRLYTFAKSRRYLPDIRISRSKTNKGNQAWISYLPAQDVDSATKSLQNFSRRISQTARGLPVPRMIILENRHTKSVEESLDYLREILPIGAEILEQHPRIACGDYFGRTNVHGNPLDTHVAGICHSLPQHSISELATLLDVYLPTRLAIGPSNLIGWKHHSPQDWEAVVEFRRSPRRTGRP